jgi:hypothetical protein
MLPRSRFTLALSSHCYILADNRDDGEFLYEADPFNGCRIIKKTDAITKRTVIVKVVTFTVPDKDKGFEFLDSQLGKGYDFKGALGIGLDPLRDWGDTNRWFCYEYAAGAIAAAGKDEFNNITHVNEYALQIIADKE